MADRQRFLLVAGYAPSLLGFRAPLIAAVQQAGLQVHVAAPELGAASAIRQELEAKGLVVHDIALQRTGMNPLADLRGLWALWRLMRSVRPQCVLAYTIKPVIYGSLAARWAGVPRRFALITGLGYAFAGRAVGLRGCLQWALRRLYELALARVQKVFFQNPDDAELFHALGLLSAAVPSVVVNGSGVDVERFAPRPAPAPEPHERMRFLLLARLLGDKGVREYAQAARQVRAQYPDARFVLAGWIDTENPAAIAQSELDAWVAAGDVEYIGKLSDVRPALADCSVFVLPSYREGVPMSTQEAMAMGRAIITTDAPGCRETVVEGENGYLVPVRDAQALATAMLRMIEAPREQLARMGACSRRMAEEKFDVRKVNARMLSEMGLGGVGEQAS